MSYSPPPPLSDKEQLHKLIYRISHDFSAPLRHIKEFTRLIIDEFPDELNEKQTLYKEYLDKSVEDFGDKLNGLLAISRLETQASEFTPVSISQLLDAYLSHHKLAFHKVDGSIKTQCANDVYIMGDQEQLLQLGNHIISNALKFKKPDDALSVLISAVVEGDNVHLTFKDNGIGMNADHLCYIFDLFNQLQPHQTEGAGVGLTLVDKIIQRHQGTIKVTSEEGKGTEVSFTFSALSE